MRDSFAKMEIKPRAATDGLFQLLLLAAGAPMRSAGRPKMDDPKQHIGPHDGKFEQKQLHFVWFIVDSHRDMAKNKQKRHLVAKHKVRKFPVAEQCLMGHNDIPQWC